MTELPQIFASRFAKARLRAGLSRRALARESNNSPAKIDSIENGAYTSKHGPCLYSIHRAAITMGVSLNDLAPPGPRPDAIAFLQSHPGDEAIPSISVVLEFLEFCDIYEKPEAGETVLKRTGLRSFIVERSGLKDPALINAEFASWSKHRQRRVYERQARAWEQIKLAELDFFDEMSKTLGKRYRAEFMLAACRVIDFDGEEVLAVLCQPM